MPSRPFDLEAFKRGEPAQTTVNHLKVWFVGINPKATANNSVVGVLENRELLTFRLDGSSFQGYQLEMASKTRKIWINLYKDGQVTYWSQQAADIGQASCRIGPARMVEIEE